MLSSSGAGVIFKKERLPDRFKRFRLGLNNLDYNIINGSGLFIFSAEAALGWEKRREIKENLEFTNGWELRAGLASFNSSTNALIGVGYILGFQYRINDNLIAGVEVKNSDRRLG